MQDCLFCKIIKGEIPSHIVYEDHEVLAFLDINPVNPGHTLVVPKQHAENYFETSEEDLKHIAATVKQIAPGILRAVGSKGFNLAVNTGAVAGQVIFHTHFHIMPRFEDDGHKLWQRKEVGSLEEIAEKIQNEIT